MTDARSASRHILAGMFHVRAVTDAGQQVIRRLPYAPGDPTGPRGTQRMDINLTAWIPFFAFAVLLMVFCLWHVIVHTPRFIPRWAWILLIVLASPLGGLIYLLVEVFDAGTKRQDAEGRQTPPE